MASLTARLFALVLEHELASVPENRVLVIRMIESGEFTLPVANLSVMESETQALDRALQETCSMWLTAKLGKVGWRIRKLYEDRVSTMDVVLCHADGIPETDKEDREVLWIEPQLMLESPVTASDRLRIICSTAAALCAPPIMEVEPHNVRKLPSCCRAAISSSVGLRRSLDFIPCSKDHLVQFDQRVRSWIIPNPKI